MMSPTPAVRRFEPPSTLMHWTRLAPLLSATSRLDCIWIMVWPLSSQTPLRRPLDTDHLGLFTLVGHHGAGENALWHLDSLLSPSPFQRGRVRSAASESGRSSGELRALGSASRAGWSPTGSAG